MRRLKPINPEAAAGRPLREEKGDSLESGFMVGDYLVEPQLNRISRNGRTTQVEPKVMRVLTALAERPAEVVTRESLLETVWADTFVGEETLTRSISELRKIFEDDPKVPRVIETIRKTGYRVIAPVKIDFTRPEQEVEQSPVIVPPPFAVARDSGWTLKRLTWPLILAGIVIALSVWFYLSRGASRAPAIIFRAVPLTRYPGIEIEPALSPDGDMLAFVWNGTAGDNLDIYVKRVNTETPLRLTSDPSEDRAPVWSPDGRRIAFVRITENEAAIWIMPALGGPETKLIDCDPDSVPSLSWSPDGEWLAYSGRDSAREPYSIFLVSVESLEKRKITLPPALHQGDSLPAISPDGRMLAFKRTSIMGIDDIYLVLITGGEARRVTFDNLKITGLDWTPDGESLIYSSNWAGNFSLWRIPAEGGTPEGVPGVGLDAYNLSVSRRGNRLAYMHWIVDTNVWRICSPTADASDRSPTQLLSSTRWDSNPQYSPDGKRIAFASMRSGSPEIWVSDSDGLNPVQMTANGGPFTSAPRWSPDGGRIVFESRVGGNADVHIIDAAGGTPRRLTEDASDELAPSWSRDGRWIYFASNRSGSWQVWKSPAGGGEAVQVTRNGGFAAAESPDGKYLYYARRDEPGLWRMPLEGGEEALALDRLKADNSGNWVVIDRGIYFIDTDAAGNSAIEFFDFATRRTSRVAAIKTPNNPGLALSPDGRWILYAQVDRADGDIMLAEKFR
ncbi:MAG: DPP IV N-terminal domain-containing protein [Blastocatellia bacterium]|nr:DPP IV N-terminal domain-containing protein [Blastocatellia bacterium]